MLNLRTGALGLTLFGALALAAPSARADGYGAQPGGMKDMAFVPPLTWTGFYVGANGGYGWAVSNSHVFGTAIDDDFPFVFAGADRVNLSPGGGFGGGQIGYNWQRDRVVFGVEADIQGAAIGDKVGLNVRSNPLEEAEAFVQAKSNLNWFGTVRGRIGYTFFDYHTLLYFTGGVAFGNIKDTLAVTEVFSGAFDSASRSETLTGFVLGGGVEYAIGPAWSLKLEYQYLNLGSERLAAEAHEIRFDDFADGAVNIDHTYHTWRVGLNYRFTPEYVPLK